MEKKILLLDIDNCLSDSERRRNFVIEQIGGICGVDGKRAREIYLEALKYSKEKLRLGGIDPESLGEIISQIVGKEEVNDRIKNFMDKIPHEEYIIPKTTEALERLSQHFLLGIQTDGPESYQTRKIESLWKFFATTDKKYINFFSNKASQIFRTILGNENNVVIVDDTPNYIRKLLDVGIEAYLINFGGYAAKNNGLVAENHVVQSLNELADKLIK